MARETSVTGKRSGRALYVHKDYMKYTHLDVKKAYRMALWNLQYARDSSPKGTYVPDESEWNVIKFNPGKGFNDPKNKVSLLMYKDFETNPHPVLEWSIVVDIYGDDSDVWRKIDYRGRAYRQILHRKELVVGREHPEYDRWAALTADEKAAGLYDKEHVRRIGNRLYWNNLLDEKGLEIQFDVLTEKDKCPECGSEKDARYYHEVDHGWEDNMIGRLP